MHNANTTPVSSTTTAATTAGQTISSGTTTTTDAQGNTVTTTVSTKAPWSTTKKVGAGFLGLATLAGLGFAAYKVPAIRKLVTRDAG